MNLPKCNQCRGNLQDKIGIQKGIDNTIYRNFICTSCGHIGYRIFDSENRTLKEDMDIYNFVKYPIAE